MFWSKAAGENWYSNLDHHDQNFMDWKTCPLSQVITTPCTKNIRHGTEIKDTFFPQAFNHYKSRIKHIHKEECHLILESIFKTKQKTNIITSVVFKLTKQNHTSTLPTGISRTN
jgi:hypothetical protein